MEKNNTFFNKARRIKKAKDERGGYYSFSPLSSSKIRMEKLNKQTKELFEIEEDKENIVIHIFKPISIILTK